LTPPSNRDSIAQTTERLNARNRIAAELLRDRGIVTNDLFGLVEGNHSENRKTMGGEGATERMSEAGVRNGLSKSRSCRRSGHVFGRAFLWRRLAVALGRVAGHDEASLTATRRTCLGRGRFPYVPSGYEGDGISLFPARGRARSGPTGVAY
jgi:hypothetical protein